METLDGALYINWNLPEKCDPNGWRVGMEPQPAYHACWRRIMDLQRPLLITHFYGASPEVQPYFRDLFRNMAMSGHNTLFIIDTGDLRFPNFYKQLLEGMKNKSVCVNLNIAPKLTELKLLLITIAIVVEQGQFCRVNLTAAHSEKAQLFCEQVVQFRNTLPFDLEFNSFLAEDVRLFGILQRYAAIKNPPLQMPDWTEPNFPDVLGGANYPSIDVAYVTPNGELGPEEALSANKISDKTSLPDMDGLFKELLHFFDVEDIKLLLPDEFWLNDPLAAAAIVLRASGRFDSGKYLETYPDVMAACCDPVEHYVRHGHAEKRTFFAHDKTASEYGGIGVELSVRLSQKEMFEILNAYDVISFDIFDTALLRTVEFPDNIFDIMALEMRWPDFPHARKIAERDARTLSEKAYGHREICIDDIYELLSVRFNVGKEWREREIELEHERSMPNKFIFEIYKKLIECGKSVIFVSDMYLPYAEIKKMLINNGYGVFERLYVSNASKLCKGYGTLQKKVREDYSGARIVHIGDNKQADKEMFEEAGIPAMWNPDQRLMTRPPYLNNIAGHICRAVYNNAMNTGLWKHNLHYTHGFRVGGILTAGYCLFINKIARNSKSEKILFCARDGYIIQKIYNDFYHEFDNEYLEISRYAILNMSPERYAYDILNRFIFRYWEQNSGRITLEQLLCHMGYDFLVPNLESHELSRFRLCASVGRDVFTNFFLAQIPVLKEHAQDSINAGKLYFSQLIGNAKNILVVDIGWSGTCISAFGHFVRNEITEDIIINGVLMCTADSRKIANEIIEGNICPYISAPTINSDLHTRMKGGVKGNNVELVHMPLEYMFTSLNASLLAYMRPDSSGAVAFLKDKNTPPNSEEILSIQDGIYEFNRIFARYSKNTNISVPPYTAFIAFKQGIEDARYTYAVYKNFLYDSCTAPGRGQPYTNRFASLFAVADAPFTSSQGKSRILFITPELSYTGTPRSLLRVCRVAHQLGYEPVVWSRVDGPFRREFEENGIAVAVVPEQQVSQKKYQDIIKSCALAFCNTIVTDSYVRLISGHIPTIWFIREASNIPDFCRDNPRRLELLKSYDKVFCVSGYAANALASFTCLTPRVLHNCVEDEKQWADSYMPGSGKKVKFAQFGTMEFRKGYDILIAAYKNMPETYQRRCELYFAGGFINSGTPYCDYIFSEMAGIPQIRYLGVITDEKTKIRILSQMDVIVVASRDESCSLVALEGAMLSRPLIVTENVGAKYMVDANNGLIVPSDDVEAMKLALMRMIDSKDRLADMGKVSRGYYEERAGMERHKADLGRLFQAYGRVKIEDGEKQTDEAEEEEIIISITSHPGRINFVADCLKSLAAQDYQKKVVILWLSAEQFPNLELDLPDALKNMLDDGEFEIRWVDDDLKPHKKYFYACREFADHPVIIADDDAIYESRMARELVRSYKKFPDCVSCHRANLIMLRPNRTFRPYDSWIMNYTQLRCTPSYQLMPTGVGGILYPPGTLPEETFDADAIKENCLYCDDLWLKMMCVKNGARSILVDNPCKETLIEGSQDVALWRENVWKNANDTALENISRYLRDKFGCLDEIMEKIRRDRFC